jgi:hypothetical protein
MFRQLAEAVTGRPANSSCPTRTTMRPSARARTNMPWIETQLPTVIVLTMMNFPQCYW